MPRTAVPVRCAVRGEVRPPAELAAWSCFDKRHHDQNITTVIVIVIRRKGWRPPTTAACVAAAATATPRRSRRWSAASPRFGAVFRFGCGFLDSGTDFLELTFSKVILESQRNMVRLRV